MPALLACVSETVCRHVLLSVCVSAGMGRGMILSQAHCAGSVSMALTHIHHHHISSSSLSLTQTLHNAAALLCARMFHFHPDSKQPYKVSAENMHLNKYMHVFLCASGWAGLIVLHRKKKLTTSKIIPPAFWQHSVPIANNSSKW